MCLRFNNLHVLYLITFFSALYFYHPIATLYYQARGLSFIEINSLWAVIVGVMAFSEVPTGIIADKIGRKLSICIALFLQLVGEAIYMVADSYWMFVAVAVVAGVGFSFSSGCFEAMMYDSLKEQKRENDMQKVSGFNGALSQSAVISGSLIGGYLARDLALDSFVLLIAMTVASVAMALFVSFFLKEPKLEYAYTEESPIKLFKSGICQIWSNKSLRRIVLLSLLVTPFSDYLLTLYQPYFIQNGVSGVWFGVALAGASFLAIFASKYAYILEKRLGVRGATLLSTVLPGIFYLLMLFSVPAWLAISLFVICYASMSLQAPIFADYKNRHIDSDNRATALSIISMFSGIYVAIMGIVIGALADRELNYAFLFMGGVIVCSALLVRIKDNHVDTNYSH